MEEIYLQLYSDPKFACLSRAFVKQSAELVGFCDSEANMITLAVDEAFSNVIRHTYKMNTTYKIDLISKIDYKHALEIHIKDYGPPIDKDKIKGRNLNDVKPGGLGVHFMHSIMDLVEYLPYKNGNTLKLVKHLANPNQKCPEVLSHEANLLKTILDIGQSMQNVLHMDTLISLIINKIKMILNCEEASIIFRNEEDKLSFKTTSVFRHNVTKRLRGFDFSTEHGLLKRVISKEQPLIINNIDKNIKDELQDEIEIFTEKLTRNMVCTPLKVRERIIGLLCARNKKEGNFASMDLEILVAIAGTIALSVDNARSHQRLLESARIKKEIESAKRMHKATLPQKIPIIDGITLSAACNPAKEIGGDYYDFLDFDNDQYAFAIGDVSGHGLEAGMMVSMAHSCLYTQINFSKEIEKIMEAMNSMVYGSVKKRLIMTFFFGIYNKKTKAFRFANAGHPSPYYYNARKKKWKLIQEGEFPLGVYEKHHYKTFTIHLYPGDILLLYSDGIIEASNQKRERYGIEKLEKLLDSTKWLSPKSLQISILDSIEEFTGGTLPNDDRTLLIIYINSDNECTLQRGQILKSNFTS